MALKTLEPAVLAACWSCAAAHHESTLFCPHCGKIQPPPGDNYFSVFGLQPGLNIDAAALEDEFHRLSRKLHPDRFARATESEKQWSLAGMALLNDAYRTLKHPLRRTAYLLKLEGAEMGEEFSGRDHAKNENGPSRAPADLLEEVFDLNMQLEEMRMARQRGESDPELEKGLCEAKRKFEGLVDEADRNLRAQWRAWDEGDAAGREAAQKAMVAQLNRRRYLSNLLRDVTGSLEG